MGFNISGLIINHNYEKSLKNLEHDFGWGIKITEEINFDQASANWTPEGEFRLHFSDKATLIFFPMNWVDYEYKSSHSDTLNYAYSATGMTFQMDLFKSGKRVRSILEIEGDRTIDEGRKLAIEKNHDSAAGLIFALIDKLLGAKLGSIKYDAKSFRCEATNSIQSFHR